MAEKGKLIRMRDLQSSCPPKHYSADAFPLVTRANCGVNHWGFFVVEIHPGGRSEEDAHPGVEHGYFMISGRGAAKVEGEEFTVEPGDFLYIPPGSKHEIKPIGGETIRFACISGPPR
jgi:quercetin dioxygenase-like cupin family protein